MSGNTLEVDHRSDGHWAVVIQRSGDALWFVLCERTGGGWFVEDQGEIGASSTGSSSWISLLADEDEDGPNVGVEITGAPRRSG